VDGEICYGRTPKAALAPDSTTKLPEVAAMNEKGIVLSSNPADCRSVAREQDLIGTVLVLFR
jgi:carbamoylphosphate synthase small subunit